MNSKVRLVLFLMLVTLLMAACGAAQPTPTLVPPTVPLYTRREWSAIPMPEAWVRNAFGMLSEWRDDTMSA